VEDPEVVARRIAHLDATGAGHQRQCSQPLEGGVLGLGDPGEDGVEACSVGGHGDRDLLQGVLVPVPHAVRPGRCELVACRYGCTVPRTDQRLAALRPAALAGYPTYLVAQVNKEVQRRMSAALAVHDLSPSHFGVLAALDGSGPLSQQQLADSLDHDKSHMVGYLDHLEQRGLVERQVDPGDRRRHRIALTPAAEQLLPSLHAADRAAQDEIFAALPADDRRRLVDLLGRVVADLDARRSPAAAPRGSR
jgi:MarR family transcriptional regulator, lower aerobic nicotinate degradation pathway regulator